jgi:hypothetical protein
MAQSEFHMMLLQLSNSLTNTTVDRHLLPNLPAVNVRMIKISFTVEYDDKPLTHVTPFMIILYVIQLHSTIVLTYFDQNDGNYS